MMNFRKRFITVVLIWGPVVSWMVLIFAGSSLTTDVIESSETARAYRLAPKVLNQVTIHLIEFGVLALLVFRGLALDGILPGRHLWLVAVVVTAAYGVTDEFHQSFVPGRYPSWLDVAYDVIGAIVGSSVALVWVWCRHRKLVR